MPLVHFSHDGRARLGKLFGDHVVDRSRGCALAGAVPQPEKYLGIGMNYRDHAVEAIKAGVETPPYQV